MAKFIISYDLSKPEREYEDLIQSIKNTGQATRLQGSVWALKNHNGSPSGLRDNLERHLDSDDSLFIAKFTSWASWNVDEASWLKS